MRVCVPAFKAFVITRMSFQRPCEDLDRCSIPNQFKYVYLYVCPGRKNVCIGFKVFAKRLGALTRDSVVG